MSLLLLLFGLGLGGYLAVWRNKRALKVKAGAGFKKASLCLRIER